jgi:hypothetical protein
VVVRGDDQAALRASLQLGLEHLAVQREGVQQDERIARTLAQLSVRDHPDGGPVIRHARSFVMRFQVSGISG